MKRCKEVVNTLDFERSAFVQSILEIFFFLKAISALLAGTILACAFDSVLMNEYKKEKEKSLFHTLMLLLLN